MERLMAAPASKLLLGCALLAMSLAACANPPAPVRIPGTYSSFAYNEEGGDLVGYEVRIIPTRHGLKAVVQEAVGEPGDIHVVEVKEAADGLSFDIPLAGERPARFAGKVTTKGLEGKITFSSGAVEQVVLKRSPSYWDR